MHTRIRTLLDFDQNITGRIQLKSSQSFRWRLAAFLAHSGDSWFWAAGMALTWLLTLGSWHKNAAVIEIAVCAQALFVFAVKARIRRPRPGGEWGSIYRQYDPHSFPSGHATRAMLLIILAVGLGPTWFSWCMIIWAPVMAFSRVLTGVHYLSDILGGMLLGLILGLLTLAITPQLVYWFPFLF